MTTIRTAAQQALEALETLVPTKGPSIYNSARDDLRAALAQQDEPVATLYGTLPIYTAPPQRPPLTDEEIDALFHDWNSHCYGGPVESHRRFARAVERKVRGEKA